MPDESSLEILPPSLTEGSYHDLSIESTIRELSLYNFQVKTSCPSSEIVKVFEKYPRLPGVILVEREKFAGMLSRRQLLEFLIRPRGLDLFLQEPVSVLYSYARTEVLVLAENTLILVANQYGLRRIPELVGEPVVVQTKSQEYRLLDAQELNIAAWQIRGIETQVRYERLQVEMIQSEKMVSLGRLVDGVAHEILEPVGFIWGNLSYVSTYSKSLLQLLSMYEATFSHLPQEITELKEEIETDFLKEDFPRVLGSIITGAERLRKLAKSLQNFCHIDEVYPKPADLHACLDSILLLISSRISSEIEIVKDYGHLPPVICFAGQINQVFMNILMTAVHVLLNDVVRYSQFPSKSNKHTYKPRIKITTQVCSQKRTSSEDIESRAVSVRIADNGPGMSPQVYQQILESFSVEKRVAQETSLALSYWIITARHGGQFSLRTRNATTDSDTETGTEFEILLPLS